jgi:hypothetical protein
MHFAQSIKIDIFLCRVWKDVDIYITIQLIQFVLTIIIMLIKKNSHTFTSCMVICQHLFENSINITITISIETSHGPCVANYT